MDSKRSRTHADMNFSVIKRYVPSLQQILAIAASASVYILTPDNSETGAEWKRADIEGTLFVCELDFDAGRHCIVVLNRKGRDNLIILSEEIENVEITAEFLTLRFNSNGEARILGFFLQCSMCSGEEICALIKGHWEIAKQSQGYSRIIYGESEAESIGLESEYNQIGLRFSL
ncbi:putative dcp1 superfamily decapping enzyme [Golovinomyces cichoracearum]|uniref:Putative dcp1 superfamily decapping enzyme n=1 Tax=Golovinomyces cichoracearum TaxID=62708 RepID=A0A420H6L6_9PEZI|nr:putative dcp1 superfamily decapping enzyme [Golovinomyces cichoracearum]